VRSSGCRNGIPERLILGFRLDSALDKPQVLEDERRAIVNYVAQYPDSGDEMKGTGGAVKKPIYRKRNEMN